ncbi:hypothetical protein SAMN05216298_3156 [Glycomyces sambucus]|uniref:Uncharacterized protein n=1 Tax=Glycomyces sambucus TaxID=380244 RepID=A0A1G9ID69_9ACTN|nr:hypothetical protein SAMN05216298_3156 [Glycomyces sambucus]
MRPILTRLLRLLRAVVVTAAGLLSANYVIPGFTLPTEPEALLTVVPLATGLVLLSAWPFLALQRRWVEPKRRADWQRMMASAEDAWSSPHESVLWRWVLMSWTLTALWILGPVPLAMFGASQVAVRLGWPSTAGGPVAASIAGLIVALLAKLAYQLANTDGRRAVLLGLFSAASAWAGLVAASRLVDGVRLGTADLQQTLLTAGIAAVVFFALPKAAVVRLGGDVEWAKAMALGGHRYWTSGITVFGTWYSLAASFLGGAFLLWLATWFAPNVLPIPLRFDGFWSLVAAAALVTAARVPVIFLARWIGDLPAMYSGQRYLRVNPLTGRVDERLRAQGRRRRETVEAPPYEGQHATHVTHTSGWGGGTWTTFVSRFGAAIEAGYGMWTFRQTEWRETSSSSGASGSGHSATSGASGSYLATLSW